MRKEKKYDGDDNHDTKIFLLALLLGSYFIYNSMGTIDENAINNLSLIVRVTFSPYLDQSLKRITNQVRSSR